MVITCCPFCEFHISAHTDKPVQHLATLIIKDTGKKSDKKFPHNKYLLFRNLLIVAVPASVNAKGKDDAYAYRDDQVIIDRRQRVPQYLQLLRRPQRGKQTAERGEQGRQDNQGEKSPR